jgi:hypothetical protein
LRAREEHRPDALEVDVEVQRQVEASALQRAAQVAHACQPSLLLIDDHFVHRRMIPQHPGRHGLGHPGDVPPRIIPLESIHHRQAVHHIAQPGEQNDADPVRRVEELTRHLYLGGTPAPPARQAFTAAIARCPP